MNADQPDASTAEADSHIAGLETQPTADQATINNLEAAALPDRAVIAQLEVNAIIDRDRIANLEAALESCRRIGAAVGIIMAIQKVTEDQAFAVLTQASQTANRKLRDVADDVLRAGTVE